MDVKPKSSIHDVVDPDSAPRAPRPDDKLEEMYSKLQKSFAKLEKEKAHLEMKLKESERQSQVTRVMLQTRCRHYYNAALKAQRERDELQEEMYALKHLEQRVQVLQVLVDDNVSPFLTSLDTFKSKVTDTTNFLYEHVVFKNYEAFEDEKQEALGGILSWLSIPLVQLLVTCAENAAASNSVGGSHVLIRVSSWALLYRHLGRCLNPDHDKPLSEAYLLKSYVNMFKIASWALLGAEIRFAFEEKLNSVLSSINRVRRLYPRVEISLHLPAAKTEYNPATMEAIDVDGQVLKNVPKGGQKIATALGFGVRNGAKVALRAQVLLVSTLQDALEKEEGTFREQPDGDGRD